jgi:hypothetical protein
MRRAGWAAAAMVIGWYVFVLAILHPLTDAPVVDSWLYASAVRRFLRTGEIRFAGFTQAMPVVQVLWGAAWGRAFGANAVSLEISTMVVAIACGIMFHALARRCGARRWQALAATGLLICNPCFTFLSFSFMTDVPFVALLIATHLAFAEATGPRAKLWLWIAAALAVIDFMIRPFAAMAIAGCAGAILIYDAWPGPRRVSLARLITMLAPFAIALMMCALVWIWLTVVRPKPWFLQLDEDQFAYIFQVPIALYLRAGILGPLLYLGTMLAPLALLQLATPHWRRTAMIGGAIFCSALLLMHLNHSRPVTPEYSCFGGWHNVLLLRGLPNRFFWESGWQYVFVALGSLGAGGLIIAFATIFMRMRRATAAVVIASAIYWLATIPLWLYNDRYYLVLVPAGALVLALAPLPRMRLVKFAAFAMTFAMGLIALGGTYSYQRGLGVILAARNALEREGVPRSSIDAGYSLNGEDLYRYPKHGIETMKLEAGIPMITSPKVDEYTIASDAIPGAEIVRRFKAPGPFGLGHRYFYLVKKRRTPARPDALNTR